ncbi:MAG: histone deacetylase [Syntrophomonadaceae bacterium]|nr:histone deacetylase [Syntrophomonadaceae bacterium]MDD3889040.1 histone deacetylase [Syntrophomonadaceae bacterium]MDD4549255.1 histone deacetylase [Syntrophomonadaceae bacterium]
MKPTGILFFPAFDWAISPTHPEREERLLYTRDQIFEEGIMDLPQIKEYQPGLADLKDIARVHFCVPDIESQITEAHLISAGSALVMADAFMQDEVKNSFAIIRPPGHHSMTVSHGNRGFCNINNEAIMVEYLRKKYNVKKIAIVDTDVHHGDGTQEIFYHDPDVLFISFHQDGRTLYPGTGFMDEAGGPLAYGSTINIPLAPGTTDSGILYVMDNLVLPILDEFKPDVIVNSAGQDNHYSDPLANMAFSAQGYARLNTKLAPDIAVLEGGYSVETALPYINMGLIMAMAGIDYSNLSEPDYKPERFKESERNLAYIKSIVKKQLDLFRHREEVVAKNRKDAEYFHNYYKQIFYDTDYIHEEQQNRLRMCPDCCGFRIINSSAQHRNGQLYRVLCIAIPVNACQQCHAEAISAYADMVKNGDAFDLIYLQDRVNDEYKVLDITSSREIVL